MTDDDVGTTTLEAGVTEDATGEGAGPVRQDDAKRERYRVLGRLGKGGMGEVMLVRDERVGRDVALKRIRRANPSDRTVHRFLREASIQGRLEHPAIVPLYDLDHDSTGQPFFTMKRLTGTTLAEILAARGEHSVQRLLRAFAEVCFAIELAHTRGIVHRDLKPDNIVLGDFGEVYVLDWGVAKVIGEPDGEFGDVSSDSNDDDNVVTVPGRALGTPGFMAPEQQRGDADLDSRADVYALGCILLEILAHSPVIPPELDELCALATAGDRTRRLASARELGERIQRYLDGDRDLATRRQLATEHLEKAQAAFALRDREDERKVAMREAASALALDPTLASAAELVGRLMMEPPTVVPAEVEAAILEDHARTVREHARVGTFVYLGLLAFTPLLWWIAPARSPYVLALSGLVLANLGLCMWGATHQPRGKEWVLALTNTVLLAVIARMYSPFLAAPGLAAVSAMAIVLTPTAARLTSAIATLVALLCVAVLGTWMLEQLGILSLTTEIGPAGVTLHAPALAGDQASTLAVAALYVVGTIGGAAGLAYAMRAREQSAHRRLHLQAWQLRQLVPR